MNRNIVTRAEAAAIRQELLRREERSADAPDGGAARPAPPSEDQWHTRLLKYIPSEAVALYLALEGVVRSGIAVESTLRVWLGFSLALSLVFAWLYLKRVAKVTRNSQVVVSMIALLAWVFAIGGVFEMFSFYAPWQGTLVLVVVSAFLALFEPRALAKVGAAP